MPLLSFSLNFTMNIIFICYFHCEVLELSQLSGFARISRIGFECNLLTIQDIKYKAICVTGRGGP
jgi:hypothetical protein